MSTLLDFMSVKILFKFFDFFIESLEINIFLELGNVEITS